MPCTVVAQVHAVSDPEVLKEAIPRVVELAGGLSIPTGRPIGIKINVCDARTPETGAVMDPQVLGGILGYLRDAHPHSPVNVLESDGMSVISKSYMRWFGYQEIIEQHGARFINLSEEPSLDVEVEGRHLKKVPVPRVVSESFYISVGKIKTNLLSKITGCLKNQFGCLPMIEKYEFHTNLADVIVDVNLAMRPDFCLVDGIIGMGGIQGPSYGTPVRAGRLIAGRDPVAIDAHIARLIGYRPGSIAHLRKSARAKIGVMKYQLAGDDLPGPDFEIGKFEIAVFRTGGQLKRFYEKKRRSSWHGSR